MTIKNILIGAVIVIVAVIAINSLKATNLGGVVSGNNELRGLATSASSTVTTSSALLLATSTARSYAAIVNDHATNVLYISVGTPAVSGKGIRVNAAGGIYEIDGDNLFTGAIYGIASGAGTNVTTLEY